MLSGAADVYEGQHVARTQVGLRMETVGWAQHPSGVNPTIPSRDGT